MGARPTGQDEPRDAATSISRERGKRADPEISWRRAACGTSVRLPQNEGPQHQPSLSRAVLGSNWRRNPMLKTSTNDNFTFCSGGGGGPSPIALKWAGEWKRTGRFEPPRGGGWSRSGQTLVFGRFLSAQPAHPSTRLLVFRRAKERLWICSRNSGCAIRFEKETRSKVMRPTPYRAPLTRALLLERRMMALGDAGRPPTTSPTPDADSRLCARLSVSPVSHLHLSSHCVCIMMLSLNVRPLLVNRASRRFQSPALTSCKSNTLKTREARACM
ncbi:hypothetical protein GQ607_008490 [Colletotrichum asianum]|uniref:Uncharacterized protein n=1 Tax=Colletotrichum asianum TaxID=702518 RepID=A0A8H3W8F7_9PEZI|nr:hypothetical protein GQ607_008490 [Colletotrichum asianum]